MRRLERILNSGFIRFVLIGGMFLIAYQLTAWSMRFGDAALLAKADLLGAAAIIGAASAAPIGILTMLANKYLDTRRGEIDERIRTAANCGDSNGRG